MAVRAVLGRASPGELKVLEAEELWVQTRRNRRMKVANDGEVFSIDSAAALSHPAEGAARHRACRENPGRLIRCAPSPTFPICISGASITLIPAGACVRPCCRPGPTSWSSPAISRSARAAPSSLQRAQLSRQPAVSADRRPRQPRRAAARRHAQMVGAAGEIPALHQRRRRAVLRRRRGRHSGAEHGALADLEKWPHQSDAGRANVH